MQDAATAERLQNVHLNLLTMQHCLSREVSGLSLGTVQYYNVCLWYEGMV